jgi:hypothetical protein
MKLDSMIFKASYLSCIGEGLLFILLNYTSQVGNSQDPYSVSNISLLQQRQNLQVQLAALQSDYDNLNARYEEESETASTLRASFSKISAEYAALKTK